MQDPWVFVAPEDTQRVIWKSVRQVPRLIYWQASQVANEALLDARLPQTATIQRGEVALEVPYDGEPSWIQVDGS